MYGTSSSSDASSPGFRPVIWPGGCFCGYSMKVVTHDMLSGRASLAHYTAGWLGIPEWSVGDTPLFSVIMPLYNKAPYVAQAIESVLAQTYPAWELVIVDDGSTDGSADIAAAYANGAENDSLRRIRLLQNGENRGCGAATNTGAQNSSGVLIGILDADDALYPTALYAMYEAYRDTRGIGWAYSQFEFCNIHTLDFVCKGFCKPIPGDGLLGKNVASHFRTFTRWAYERTGGFDEDLSGAFDRDQFYQLEEVADGTFVDRVLYRCLRSGRTWRPIKGGRTCWSWPWRPLRHKSTFYKYI
jgi:glycosyltransferase involved in cell wall biosynthesis